MRGEMNMPDDKKTTVEIKEEINEEAKAAEEATEEESVLLQLTKTADKEELKPFLFNNLNAIIQNMAKDMDQETLTSDLEKLYDTAKMSITDQIVEVVHLDTGWPIEYLFRRDVEMVISDEAGGQITQTTFTIIPQEEEQ